jgi:hypothetical protein
LSFFDHNDVDEIITRIKEMSDEEFKKLALKAGLIKPKDKQDDGDES